MANAGPPEDLQDIDLTSTFRLLNPDCPSMLAEDNSVNWYESNSDTDATSPDVISPTWTQDPFTPDNMYSHLGQIGFEYQQDSYGYIDPHLTQSPKQQAFGNSDSSVTSVSAIAEYYNTILVCTVLKTFLDCFAKCCYNVCNH